jgi:hypothetical protein
MNLLVITCPHIPFQLVFCAEASEDMLADKDWFECCIAKDYASGAEAVEAG